MSTVVDLLRQRAETQPAAPAFHFVDNTDAPGIRISYRELDVAARRVATALVERGASGRPVLLLYPPGVDYVIGFLGCLYAAAIAVPAYPPDPGRWSRTLPRLRALAADCGASVALGTSALVDHAPGLAGEAPELTALDWVATDTLPSDANTIRPVSGDSPALLQYTSGSTGSPRGVLLSHANLLHNAELVRTGFGTSPDSVGVSWLPPYHDMGLIGGILQPLYAGFPITLMSPLTFLQRPLAWLETIARFGATVSGGPNFAFDLCVRKTTPQQREALDLSRWKVAFCGAEPIRAQTLDRFAEAFAAAGFRKEAFYPCYGLAEATLIVTGAQSPRTVSDRVGCGRPLGEQKLAIVDPETGTPRPAGSEGEIWLSGPSVAQGYWGQPDETERTFAARLAGEKNRRYLRTGDLGFLDPDGELVVTGRIKDLIIVRGRNLYPQDIEHAVEQEVAGLRPGCSAAFPVERAGLEGVGVACELAAAGEPDAATGPDAATAMAAIRRVVAETAQVQPAVVVLLRRGRVPKTSSGKVQRHACRRAVLHGEWGNAAPDVVSRWDDSVPDELGGAVEVADRTSHLDDLVAGILGTSDAVPVDAPLTQLGLDSLRAIELQGILATRLGVRVTIAELLTGATVAELRDKEATPPVAAAVSEDPSQDSAAVEQPASDGQRALWLLQRWAPDSTAYQISRAARIRSRVDAEALDRALRAVVARHPELRTCLPVRDGQPVRRRFDWSGPVLARHDVTGLGEAELRQRVQADADRPFDLATGPLLRVSLYSRGAADHVLLLSLHHTITDFWSMSVLVDELLTRYRNAATLPATAPNSDHMPAAGRREPPSTTEDTATRAKRAQHWREVLADAPLTLDVPTSFPRPRLQSFQGDSHQFRVPAATLRRLDALAAEAGVTRFAALAAGFAAVLARYTGENDVIVGAPAAGRGGADHDRQGYFVNAVPLRIQIPPDSSYRELLRRTQGVVVDALDHAMPFPALVEALAPTRDPSLPPVMQTMLALQRAPAGRPDLGAFAVSDESVTIRLAGLDVQPYRLAERGSPFDISLMAAEVDGGLTAELIYCRDLFDAPAMARLAGHLSTLLDRAANLPDAPLSTVDLMDEQERAAVLALGTGAAVPFPDQTDLAELFAERARQQPDACAVVYAGQRLSYAELDRRTDQLAARLAGAHRVRGGDLVGVYLPRGVDAVVAFWGALKSGGGYLPLAPDLPPGRLEWMLGDARPAVVLTHRAMAERLPSDQPRLHLDEPTPADSGTGQPGPIEPDDVAYALYTSGSTGRPKAVLLDHRGACNLAWAEINGLEVTPASRVLQFCSAAYDVHVSETLVAHLAGAELHIPEPAATVPGPELVALLARERITHTWQTPSVLAALPDVTLPDLTHILCGGEACRPEVVARWVAPGRRFLNGYGPAETTVCAAWTDCEPDGRRPPIGRPLPNIQVYVLDRQLAPVPVGVPGEICIGGAGVGRGYLGRPELTARQFVPDPFAENELGGGTGPGARLYRTGDRARWLPDGRLDFLGRFDDQVKIRGVRIEPGEVAARLRELLDPRQVAVVSRPGPSGAELVAYLVTADAQRPVAELRELLRAELSEPWLPAAFVYLDALPLNRSGKLDRRALPAPAPAERGLTTPLAPRTELEKLVTEVWEARLNRSPIGVRDHFFEELGGSSLLVASVTSELSRRLARDVPVTWLFEYPTVESLAHQLSGGVDGDKPGEAPEDWAALRRRKLPGRRARLLRSTDDGPSRKRGIGDVAP
jgi:amino acid adenylation domain-containing protein